VAFCQGPGQEPICEAGGEVQTFLGVYLRRRRLAQQNAAIGDGGQKKIE
jgi:hypothetical protein